MREMALCMDLHFATTPRSASLSALFARFAGLVAARFAFRHSLVDGSARFYVKIEEMIVCLRTDAVVTQLSEWSKVEAVRRLDSG